MVYYREKKSVCQQRENEKILRKYKSCLDKLHIGIYTFFELNSNLQGRVQFPTGGTAHEPQGMIR